MSVELSHDRTPDRNGRYPWAAADNYSWIVCGTAANAVHAERTLILEFADYIRRQKDMGDTTVVERPTLTTAQLVERYLKLRDKKEELQKQHKDQLKPFTETMAKIEAVLLDKLNTEKEESKNTEFGTAYKTTHTSASVVDWSATLEYIKQFDVWELLEARVSKGAVLAIMEDLQKEAAELAATGQQVDPSMLTIPGVKITQVVSVNVRRS